MALDRRFNKFVPVKSKEYSSLNGIKNYFLNRYHDFGDILKVGINYNAYGAKVILSTNGVGLFLAQGKEICLPSNLFANIDKNKFEDLTLLLTIAETYPCTSRPNESYTTMSRGNFVSVKGPFEIMLLSFHTSDYFRIGASVGFFLGVRIEFNPAELLDFLLGVVGIDLFQDDIYVTEPNMDFLHRAIIRNDFDNFNSIVSDLNNENDGHYKKIYSNHNEYESDCKDAVLLSSALGRIDMLKIIFKNCGHLENFKKHKEEIFKDAFFWASDRPTIKTLISLGGNFEDLKADEEFLNMLLISSVYSENRDGFYPCFDADYVRALQFFLSQGFKIKWPSENQYSITIRHSPHTSKRTYSRTGVPFYYFFENLKEHHQPLIQTLLDHGVDFSLKDKRGKLPYELTKDPKIREFLKCVAEKRCK
nr:hypothetical protein [Leptospira tipperaryensis]